MGNRLQWQAAVDGVDCRDGGVDEVSTTESTTSYRVQEKDRRVDNEGGQDGTVDRVVAV